MLTAHSVYVIDISFNIIIDIKEMISLSVFVLPAKHMYPLFCENVL